MADKNDTTPADGVKAKRPGSTAGRFRKYPELASLVREPHESDEEWTKRLDRERARLKKGGHVPIGSPKIETKKGQRRGKLTLPAEMRAELAQKPGEGDEDHKRRYQRAVMARYRERNRGVLNEKRRALYAEQGQGEAKTAWNAANREKCKSYSRAHFERNRGERLANLKKWGEENPGRLKAAQKAWADANRHVFTASTAKIRAKIIQRTPAWADWTEIQKFYNEARKLTRQTGIEHQVDHIVPLNGKNVSGLHVHYNLQVITKDENLKKRNYFDPLAEVA